MRGAPGAARPGRGGPLWEGAAGERGRSRGSRRHPGRGGAARPRSAFPCVPFSMGRKPSLPPTAASWAWGLLPSLAVARALLGTPSPRPASARRRLSGPGSSRLPSAPGSWAEPGAVPAGAGPGRGGTGGGAAAASPGAWREGALARSGSPAPAAPSGPAPSAPRGRRGPTCPRPRCRKRSPGARYFASCRRSIFSLLGWRSFFRALPALR